VATTTPLNFTMDKVNSEDAADLLKRSFEKVAEHRSILHALEWPRKLVDAAVNFHLYCYESVKRVLQNQIDPVVGWKEPFFIPEMETGLIQDFCGIVRNSLLQS
jgi:hypothetical protein